MWDTVNDAGKLAAWLTVTHVEKVLKKASANAMTQKFSLTLLIVVSVALFANGQVPTNVSEQQRKDFIDYLKKLPFESEFFTNEDIRKSRSKMPVLLALTEDDTKDFDIYPLLAFSRGLSEYKVQRTYAVKHFFNIQHPTIKMFWAARLFDENVASSAIKKYLRDVLATENEAKLLKEMLGPDYETFRRKLIKKR